MMARIVVLIFCVFMGITAVSMGVGAAYPPINRIAKPFVCADGEMTYQQSTSNPLPGRTYLRASWMCVEPSGAAQPIGTLELGLFAGSMYGLGFFVLLLALMGRRRARPAGTSGVPPMPRG